MSSTLVSDHRQSRNGTRIISRDEPHRREGNKRTWMGSTHQRLNASIIKYLPYYTSQWQSHSLCKSMSNVCCASRNQDGLKKHSRGGTEEKGPPLTSITRSHSRSGWWSITRRTGLDWLDSCWLSACMLGFGVWTSLRRRASMYASSLSLA